MSDDEIKQLFAEARRHFDIVAERLEFKFALLTDHHALHLDDKVNRLDEKLDTLREDMRRNFEETQAMIRFSP